MVSGPTLSNMNEEIRGLWSHMNRELEQQIEYKALILTKSVQLDRANLDSVSETLKLSGTLYIELIRICKKSAEYGYSLASQWIDVNDRLPEESDDYIVFCDNEVSLCYINPTDKYFELMPQCEVTNKVTHWQHINPPKK